ncbi:MULTISPECIES: DUF3662 and FHA domain-containing protein [unclassified Adlercreutzia]|uniref:FhaA domain-containing protein n=1 Tax=unclassified Adlercreutzia TaxID=2636013 RepID=UPI0013E9F43F|nr:MULTISPECIES: DUF3662 and FHA domain-containing protein [unclassified Adlercreutzia]
MGFLSKFEGKMEDTVEGAAEKMGASPISPVQIAKKAEKQMRRNKMVGAGKQYAPTLYTILVSQDDDARLFGYYPTLAGETETYLAAKAAEHGLVMDGQPLVRFIADADLKHGKFEVIAEMVAAPLVAQLRQEEMERYGIAPAPRPAGRGRQRPMQRGARPMPQPGYAPQPAVQPDPYAPAPAYGAQAAPAEYAGKPQTMMFGQEPLTAEDDMPPAQDLEAYLYDITNDRAFTLTGHPMSIGRESRNDIVIPDINASRRHAEIHMEPTGTWVLADLGSTNGTFVNGRQIKSVPLRDADHLIIGTTELEFQLL